MSFLSTINIFFDKNKGKLTKDTTAIFLSNSGGDIFQIFPLTECVLATNCIPMSFLSASFLSPMMQRQQIKVEDQPSLTAHQQNRIFSIFANKEIFSAKGKELRQV